MLLTDNLDQKSANKLALYFMIFCVAFLSALSGYVLSNIHCNSKKEAFCASNIASNQEASIPKISKQSRNYVKKINAFKYA